MATQYANTPYYLYDQQVNVIAGEIFWQPYSASVATKFTWALGSNSNLYLPHAIAGYPYLYYPYLSLAGQGASGSRLNHQLHH
jgi:hypothetical protein